jgi:hypothetical protein
MAIAFQLKRSPWCSQSAINLLFSNATLSKTTDLLNLELAHQATTQQMKLLLALGDERDTRKLPGKGAGF